MLPPGITVGLFLKHKPPHAIFQFMFSMFLYKAICCKVQHKIVYLGQATKLQSQYSIFERCHWVHCTISFFLLMSDRIFENLFPFIQQIKKKTYNILQLKICILFIKFGCRMFFAVGSFFLVCKSSKDFMWIFITVFFLFMFRWEIP